MILKPRMSSHSFAELYRYLEQHENDIAHEMHDFGNLKRLFIEIFGRAPMKDSLDE